MPVNFGYGIGLEFRESILAINSKNEKEIEEGMVFNVYVAMDGFKFHNKEYAIYIGDTVIVRNGGNEIVTFEISKAYKNITYSLQENNEKQKQKIEIEDNDNQNY